jgi:hypothetical protein
VPDSPHPVGGEGVGSTLLDVGGLWSSDEARGTQTSGVLEDVDGWRLPARRAPVRGTSTGYMRRTSSPVRGRKEPGGCRQGPRKAGGRRARGKRRRGAGCLVETVKSNQHRASPVAPRPPRTFQRKRRKDEDARLPLPPSPGEGGREATGWGRPGKPRTPTPAPSSPSHPVVAEPVLGPTFGRTRGRRHPSLKREGEAGVWSFEPQAPHALPAASCAVHISAHGDAR